MKKQGNESASEDRGAVANAASITIAFVANAASVTWRFCGQPRFECGLFHEYFLACQSGSLLLNLTGVSAALISEIAQMYSSHVLMYVLADILCVSE